MPPKTRSSTSQNSSTSGPSSTPRDPTVDEAFPLSSEHLDDSDVLATFMDSIKAANRTIDAITLLTAQTASIDTNTKMGNTILDFPKLVDVKLETIQESLRSNFSDSLSSFRNKFLQDLSSQRDATELCFKSHANTITTIASDVLTVSKNLTALQECTLSKLDVKKIVVQKWEDELDPHIKSHYNFKTRACTHLDSLDNTLQDTITTLKCYSQIAGTNTLCLTLSRPIRLHQPSSKDFSVSKLQKELKEIKLSGDSLHNLEIFWDSILGAFTNICQVDQAYFHYQDLLASFTFEQYLVDSVTPQKYLPANSTEAKHNYRSFGDTLCIFLNSGTSITEASSPKTYLKLLSLSDTTDGFLLLRDLVFSLSPQLSGDHYDFRNDIEALTIITGEHLSKFYQRVLKLSTEITLSNIRNGNQALLAYHFIFLLRSIQCPTITVLLMSYWSAILKHHRNPKHITTTLPWHYKDVYDDLITSGITTLSIPVVTSPITPTAFAAHGHHPTKHTMINKSLSPKPTSSLITTIRLHQTRDGRKFISHNNVLSSTPQPTCLLCHNKPVNPWHDTTNCPHKHPTQVLPKDIRERVMQHNALHGAEKLDYTKSQDLPDKKSTPPQAASAITSVTDSIATTLSSSPALDTSTDTTTPTDADEIVETEYFDIPFPPAIANLATTTSPNPYQDIESDAFIPDALQYLAYDS